MHGYLIGATEGRSVLDAVRAARKAEPRLSKRFVIAGHSQGGHAALFAASLAPTWTPDLKLRGTVAFAPASHLGEQFPLVTQLATPGGGLGAIVGLGLRAVATTTPTVNVESFLTPQAAALFPQTATECYDRLSESGSFGGLPLNGIFQSGADITPIVNVVSANDPETLRPKTPVRVEQGEADGTVFKAFTDQLVDEYAANGVDVSYKTYPGVSHGGIVDKGAGSATKFIKSRFK